MPESGARLETGWLGLSGLEARLVPSGGSEVRVRLGILRTRLEVDTLDPTLCEKKKSKGPQRSLAEGGALDSEMLTHRPSIRCTQSLGTTLSGQDWEGGEEAPFTCG